MPVFDGIDYYGESLKDGYPSDKHDIYDEYVLNTVKRVLPPFVITSKRKRGVVIWRDSNLRSE